MFHYNSCTLRSYPSPPMDAPHPQHLVNHLPPFYPKSALSSSPVVPCSSCICISRPSHHYCSLPSYTTSPATQRTTFLPFPVSNYERGRYFNVPYGPMDSIVRDYRSVAAFRGRRERTRRPRTIFKPTQLKGLETYFQKSQYIDRKERTKLASTLHLTDRQIKVWYQNRRAKNRRNSHEISGKEHFDEDDEREEDQIEIDIESHDSTDSSEKLDNNERDLCPSTAQSYSDDESLRGSPISKNVLENTSKEAAKFTHQHTFATKTTDWRQISHSYAQITSVTEAGQGVKKKSFFSIQSLLQ